MFTDTVAFIAHRCGCDPESFCLARNSRHVPCVFVTSQAATSYKLAASSRRIWIWFLVSIEFWILPTYKNRNPSSPKYIEHIKKSTVWWLGEGVPTVLWNPTLLLGKDMSALSCKDDSNMGAQKRDLGPGRRAGLVHFRPDPVHYIFLFTWAICFSRVAELYKQ